MSVGTMTSQQMEAYQAAAAKYKKELLALPILGLQEILPYATLVSGVRYRQVVGNPNLDLELAPYNPNLESTDNLAVNFRALETFFGAVNWKFDPHSVVNKLMGEQMTFQGDGIKDSDIARQCVINAAKSIARKLNSVIFSAAQQDDGTTTATLFNGYDTITASEITGGGLTTTKKNLYNITTAITAQNAVTQLKAMYRAASPELRMQDTVMFVSQDILDMYNDHYETLHAATPYNERFEQTMLEGSNNRCVIVPLSSKAGSQYIHLTTKENMLIGCDQMSDMEYVEVARFSPFNLNFIMKMFFGVNFETLDSRRLLVGRIVTNSPVGGSEQ